MLSEFPVATKLYESESLFSTFAQRIPSKKRPDYSTLLKRWGLTDSATDFEILAASKGVLLTDCIELFDADVVQWCSVTFEEEDSLILL